MSVLWEPRDLREASVSRRCIGATLGMGFVVMTLNQTWYLWLVT